MLFTIVYLSLSVLAVIVDVIMGVSSIRKQDRSYQLMGNTCLSASWAVLTHMVAVLARDRWIAELFYGLNFIFVDLMLFGMLVFTYYFTGHQRKKITVIVHYLLIALAALDSVNMLTNVYFHHVVEFAWQDAAIVHFKASVYHPLYSGHVLFNYCELGAAVAFLVDSAIVAPSGYRRRYLLPVAGIMAAVAANTLFLYFPKEFLGIAVDFSTIFSALTMFFIYWSCEVYPRRGMLNHFRGWILNNAEQGIALFDYTNHLLMRNERMLRIMPPQVLRLNQDLKSFANAMGIDTTQGDPPDTDSVFQVYIKDVRGISHPYRCNHKLMRDNKGRIIGRMYSFMDVSMNTDVLTGYTNWSYFKQNSESLAAGIGYPITVTVADINALGVINDLHGRSVGDKLIHEMAGALKEIFPGGTYFVRGRQATLVTMTRDMAQEECKACLNRLKERMDRITEEGVGVSIQYAYAVADGENIGLYTAARQAMHAMHSKKLTDRTSSHSEVVNSLLRALQQCDHDTEAHVRRTQLLGEKLGRRLGLTDAELSDLSLLCVLHDIGKVGIPLQILNKPGPLNEAEWEMLKTHVIKGYQITMSSSELRSIADMVKHHHERWDGRGYPDRLSKESIPLLSRVISVVDSYDAMVSDRSYRAKMTKEQACAELRKCAGTQFDPSIVAEMLDMLQVIPQDIAELPDNSTGGKSEPFNDLDLLVQRQNKDDQHAFVHPVVYARYLLDESGEKIIEIDHNFTVITGYTKDDIRQMNLRQIDLLPQEDRVSYLTMLQREFTKNTSVYVQHRLVCKDGRIIYVFCLGRVYYDASVRANRSEIWITDTMQSSSVKTLLGAEHERARTSLSRWQEKYRCDSLTGLLSHEAYQSDVQTWLMKDDTKVMLLMMDVDHFKEYNDTLGHRAGDEFLIMMANALRESVGERGLACRMGGDEFSVALYYDANTDEEFMRGDAQSICDRMNMLLSGQERCGMSLGAVFSGPNMRNFNRLYEAADKALYKAKNTGRGRMCFYGDSNAR